MGGEDKYISDTLQKMKKVFDTVEKQIKENLDCRLKEYSPEHKINYEIGSHVLVFNPKRKSSEAAKLKREWSLPFMVTKKLNYICFEMESLKFKINCKID